MIQRNMALHKVCLVKIKQRQKQPNVLLLRMMDNRKSIFIEKICPNWMKNICKVEFVLLVDIKVKQKVCCFQCVEISFIGNILIKFVDVNGRFVEVENTSNQPRDLTGWYIERKVDGRRINYTFPVFELDSHKTVRIYGNYHRRPSLPNEDDSIVELIAPNFRDWETGQEMYTELFNHDEIGKASFEQTIIQD